MLRYAKTRLEGSERVMYISYVTRNRNSNVFVTSFQAGIRHHAQSVEADASLSQQQAVWLRGKEGRLLPLSHTYTLSLFFVVAVQLPI